MAGTALRDSDEERRIDRSTTNRRAVAADLLQIASSLTIDAISDCCPPFVRGVAGAFAFICLLYCRHSIFDGLLVPF
jgi:hypothetical protein